MIAVVILIALVTVLSVYSALGTSHNHQDIEFLKDVTKGIGVNEQHIYRILEMMQEMSKEQDRILEMIQEMPKE